MKIIVVVMLLALFSSVTNAEMYKWEDANGVHFTDNASSVPEKYREKHLPDNTVQTKDAVPQVGNGIAQQYRPAVIQPYIPPVTQPAIQQYQIDQAAAYQANLEQQRRTMEVMRQQQARNLAISSKKVENAVGVFAGFMLLYLIGLFVLLVVWISTIVDIVKSEFVNPSNKTVWILLVIFIPVIGMILYFILGQDQKHKTTKFSRNNKWDSNSRDNRREFKGRL